MSSIDSNKLKSIKIKINPPNEILSFHTIRTLLKDNTTPNIYKKLCNTNGIGLKLLELLNQSSQASTKYTSTKSTISKSRRFTTGSTKRQSKSHRRTAKKNKHMIATFVPGPPYTIYYEKRFKRRGLSDHFFYPTFNVVIRNKDNEEVAYWGLHYENLTNLRTTGISVDDINLNKKNISSLLLAILMIKLKNYMRKDTIFGICADASDGYWASVGLTIGRYDYDSARRDRRDQSHPTVSISNSDCGFDRQTTFEKLCKYATGYFGGITNAKPYYAPFRPSDDEFDAHNIE